MPWTLVGTLEPEPKIRVYATEAEADAAIPTLPDGTVVFVETP